MVNYRFSREHSLKHQKKESYFGAFVIVILHKLW